MMKTILLTCLFTLSLITGVAQSRQSLDSLKHLLAIAKQDTSRVLILVELGDSYRNSNSDSSIMYGQQALAMSQSIKFFRGEARALRAIGLTRRLLGDIPKSFELLFKGLQIAEDKQYLVEIGICLSSIGDLYYGIKDYSKSINYYQRARKINAATQDEAVGAGLDLVIGRHYRNINQLDSALSYGQKAYTKLTFLKLADSHPFLFIELGSIQFKLGNQRTAFEYLRKSVQINRKNKRHRFISISYNIIAEFFKEMNQPDSCIYYAKKGLVEAQVIDYKSGILVASSLLAELYESKDSKEALYYHKIARLANDELYGINKVLDLQKIISNEQERQREIETTRMAYQNRLKQYALLAGLGMLLLIAFILYRSNRQKQKANNLLHQQKEEIETTLSQLKSTQTQLIQSEKMASLGELTAGIAHEIQNPLNFVNNFSEVNTELIEEMKEQLATGNQQQAIEIANDIKSNEQKINHHGKRADAIVKGMLQHSRSSSGVKEPTDINALCDEYLRLSYHGLRAKDKSFNATMKTDFDESIGNINIIPQDIGRVILNLITNAFYVVDEKSKLGDAGYEPTVTIITSSIQPPLGGRSVQIKVSDNGGGIPQKILDKIFQPFFTTKPTGQGTGLGLSLSYDIIKAHGGELKVETKEGEGAEFIIQIPKH